MIKTTLKLSLILMLAVSSGCKKEGEATVTPDPTGVTKDAWTQVSTAVFKERVVDYTIGRDGGIRYMDLRNYYSIDAQYGVVANYKLSEYGNIPRNEFYDDQFLTWFYTDANSQNEKTTYQMLHDLIGSGIDYSYISTEAFFGSGPQNRVILSVAQTGRGFRYPLVAGIRTKKGDSLTYGVAECHLNAVYGNVTGYFELPDNTEPISAVVPIKDSYLILGSKSNYTMDYFGNSTKLNILPPTNTYYAWHYNGRVFFTSSTNAPFLETSDGASFKETIPGLYITQMHKPSASGYALCNTNNGDFALVNLNTNKFLFIDSKGLGPNSFTTTAAMVYNDNLLLFTDKGIFARKWNNGG
jgi:hypothetical protein